VGLDGEAGESIQEVKGKVYKKLVLVVLDLDKK